MSCITDETIRGGLVSGAAADSAATTVAAVSAPRKMVNALFRDTGGSSGVGSETISATRANASFARRAASRTASIEPASKKKKQVSSRGTKTELRYVTGVPSRVTASAARKACCPPRRTVSRSVAAT